MRTNKMLSVRMKLFTKKEESKNYPHIANVYMSDEEVIIAPCFNHGGLSAEIPDEAVMLSRENKSELGEQLIIKLKQSCYKGPSDYSKHTNKDWPAFVISGQKTVKSFEKMYATYYVRGVNESNLFYKITSPKLRNGIELQLSFNANEIPLQVGIELLKIHEYYLQCRQNT